MFVLWILLFLGLNGRIEYSITAGDDNADFEINENGILRTKRILDRETTGTYNLIVTARDMAREPEKRLSSTVQVKYNVFLFFFYIYFLRFFFSNKFTFNI